jgi:hypothetical protein
MNTGTSFRLRPEEKIARLNTYNGEKLVSSEFVRVPEQWEQWMGPYDDLIPFAVGSNQEIVEIDEGDEISLWCITVPKEVELTDKDSSVKFTLHSRIIRQTLQGRCMMLNEQQGRQMIQDTFNHNSEETLACFYGPRWREIEVMQVP